jgi:hypothetical protein
MRMLRAGYVLIVTAALAGCATTYPTQAVLDPARFENDSVRVEWAAGASFFRMKLSNLTDAPLLVDMGRSAVISVDGEARTLAAVTRRDVTTIPPKAYVILASEQGVVYGTDIFGRFNQEPEDRYPLPGSAADDRIFLRAHIGEAVRLYLVAEVRGKSATYDMVFRITGASRVGAKAEAAPAAPPPPPVVQPAPGAKAKP